MARGFISWSSVDARIEPIATKFKNWFNLVFEGRIDTFFSKEINPGKHGVSEVYQGLRDADFGFVMLSQRTAESPWVLYEFGHLQSTLKEKKVFPILFDMTPGQLPAPIREFQAVGLVDHDGMQRLITSVADLLGYSSAEKLKVRSLALELYPDLLSAVAEIKTKNIVLPDHYEGRIRYNSNIKRSINFQMPGLFKAFTTELFLVGINLNFLLNLRRSSDIFVEMIDSILEIPGRKVRILISDLWDEKIRYTYDKIILGSSELEMRGLDEVFTDQNSSLFLDTFLRTHLGARYADLRGRLEIRALPMLFDTFWFVDVDMTRPSGSLMLLPMTAGMGAERPALYFDAQEHHSVFQMYHTTMRQGLDISTKRLWPI